MRCDAVRSDEDRCLRWFGRGGKLWFAMRCLRRGWLRVRYLADSVRSCVLVMLLRVRVTTMQEAGSRSRV